MKKDKITAVEKIIDRLIKEEIDYSETYDLIKDLPKPWHRPEWKELRDQSIKDHCEKCNTKEGSMVIQHTKHPSEFSEIKAALMKEFVGNSPEILSKINLLREHKYYQSLSKVVSLSQFNIISFKTYVNAILDEIDIDVSGKVIEAGIERDCCPECDRLVTDRHYRKTLSKYKCEDGHLFEVPHKIIWYKKYRTKDINEAKRSAKLSMLKNHLSAIDNKIYMLTNTVDQMIGKEALLKAFEEHTLYMSMKYTKTYCKSCAYQEDLDNGKIRK